MKRRLLFFALLLLTIFNSKAASGDSSAAQPDTAKIREIFEHVLKINNSFQKGKIDLGKGMAQITVPTGYKFLDEEKSKYVMTELWGNPPSENTLGLLMPDSSSIMGGNFTYAVEYLIPKKGTSTMTMPKIWIMTS